MRFFILHKMVRALRINAVTRAEFYCYASLLIFLSIDSALTSSADFGDTQTHRAYLLLMGLDIFLSLLVAYRANKTGDGKQFWYRYFSLSWPITWAVFVLSLPVYAVKVGLGFKTVRLDSYPLFDAADTAIMGIMMLVGTYLMYVSMRKVSAVKKLDS